MGDKMDDLGGYRGLQKGVKEPLSFEAKEVLRLLISLGYQPSKIAQILNKSRKNVYKHIKQLTEKEYFDKVKGVTRGGLHFAELSRSPNKKEYRINHAQVFFDLPQGVDRVRWRQNKGRILSLKKIQFDSLELGSKEKYERFWLFDRFDCRVHSTGVMVYFPHVYGLSGGDAERLLIGLVRQVAEELSKIFRGVDFLKDNTLRFRIVNYELAHVGDVVAKGVRENGKKLFVWVEGKLRLICDYSLKMDELETTTVEHGLEDQFAVQGYIKDILKEGVDVLKPSEVRGLLEENIGILKDLESRQGRWEGNIDRYNENIEKHLEVLGEMSRTLKEIQKSLNR